MPDLHTGDNLVNRISKIIHFEGFWFVILVLLKIAQLNNRQLFLKHLAQTSPSPIGIEVEKAEGIYIYDPSGKKYIDFISGISVSNTGHRHPKVLEAIQKQTERYFHVMVYGEYIQDPQVKLSQYLSRLLPDKLSVTYFVNSGSEAAEGALKLAKRYTGRAEIIAYENAYHGSSHGSLSIMGNEKMQIAFRPLLPQIKHIGINDYSDLEQITNSTACVIIEPIQGEAGVIKAQKDYLIALREKCTQTGTLLIFDEVQTGFGRTGSLFAFQNYDVIPDILVVAKGMGGGLPIGAFISSGEIMSTLSYDPVLGHITTFGGNALCCAAALGNLEAIIEENLIEGVEKKSRLIVESFSGLQKVRAIRAAGLLIALEMESYEVVQAVINKCLEKGLITDWFLFNDKSLRIAPPLIISEEEIKLSCAIIREAMSEPKTQ